MRNEHERQIFIAAPFDLPGTENTTAVSIDQDRNDELRVIGILTFDTIATFNGSRINLLEQIGKEVALITRGKQIKNITGKQLVLIKFNRA